MKKHFIFALSVLSLAGCQKNEPGNNQFTDDGVVKYAVATKQSEQTKAAALAEVTSLTLSDKSGALTIPMECEVSEGIALASEPVITKGTQVNTTGDDNKTLDTFVNIVGSFVAKAYDANGTEKVFQTVSWSQSSSTWDGSPVAYWPQGESLNFLAYANLPSGQTASIASTGVSTSHTVPATADAQTDIIFGHYSGKGGNTGTAEIRFEHPLTAVRFLRGEIDDDLVIKSISLEGVAASGTVAMDAEELIEWSGVSDYTHSVSQTNASGLPLTTLTGYTAKLIGEPFIIIPQDLEENNVTVTVTLVDDTVFEAMLSAGTWQAGKTNTYTLSLAEDYLLPGIFNVGTDSNPQYVRFTKGNLQASYNDGNPIWRFAKNQYDIIGYQNITEYNIKTDGSYPWYDLFGWGATGKAASGVDAVPFWENGGNPNPTGSATEQAKFRKDINTNGAELSLDDDWGANIVGNAPAKTFQTLTNAQWINLLNRYKPKKSSITIGGTIHNGMVIQPSGTPEASYTLSEWKNAEKNGAVFFPSAGYRNGNTSVNYNSEANEDGFFYWSRTLSNEVGQEQSTYKLPYGFGLYGDKASYTMVNWRSTGRPVRLVALQ